MKLLKCFALSALVMCLFSGCSGKYETVKNDPLKTKIYTLDNGLRIYMTVNDETPRIQTYIAVKVGSKNDPAETTGLAHYFEHLMFKGSENFGTSDYAAEKPMLDEIEALFETYRATDDEAERAAIYHRIDSISYEASKLAIPNEYDKLMAMIGADGTNAWTSNDETVYTEDIPSNQIDNWARIQADRFRHGVIRGFHTELETIYEEKNMSLTQDSRKIWEGLLEELYPNHPYGRQTTLGSQEHLKNPSITNVKKYHDQYYVPNNIAICVSGDFDPDEMVAAIEKYFGDWEPNPNVPVLQYESETPITEPVFRDVYGLESEVFAMGWRYPGARDLKTAAVAEIAGSILDNGKAGLLDVDVNQAQKALYLGAGASTMPDYGMFVFEGQPKQGQTLEELRVLALEELEKLRSGDFDESLISSIVNNIKLSYQRRLESNSARANMFVDAFISGIDWADAVGALDRYAAVTKEDVVAFANEYLDPNASVTIYKRMGEDKSVQKIAAPKITPIVTNRDKQSDFLVEIQNTVVKPIEPVYVDFSKDMSQTVLAAGTPVLYKQNEINDIFTLRFNYRTGVMDDPATSFALAYLDYLDTPGMTAEERGAKIYDLATSFRLGTGAWESSVSMSGLSENMAETIAIVEDLVFNAIPDEEVLESLKDDVLRSRANAKKSQSNCYNALVSYAMYGPEYVSKITLSDAQLRSLTSEQLLARVKELYMSAHEVQYYGPMAQSDVVAVLDEKHSVTAGLELPERRYSKRQTTPGSQVIIAPYESAQIYYLQYSNDGTTFKPEAAPELALYNNYFGGGMNTIVFQEMREARGLAYSAWANLSTPAFADDSYYYRAFIATQNDKMRQAIEAFDDIINDMPESEAAFDVAKSSLVSSLRTQRTTGMGVFYAYEDCQRMGLEEPLSRYIFENVQDMTLEDVVAAQRKWVKDREYSYLILGKESDLDMRFLSTLGPVKRVSLEEIFGY